MTAGEWLSATADVLSIVGAVAAVLALLQIDAVRRRLLSRARLPELLSDLRSLNSSLREALESGLIATSVTSTLARLAAVVDDVAAKRGGDVLESCRRLLPLLAQARAALSTQACEAVYDGSLELEQRMSNFLRNQGILGEP